MSKNSRTAQGSTSSTLTLAAQINALEEQIAAMHSRLQTLHAEKKGFDAQLKELLEKASKLKFQLADNVRAIENRESDLNSLRAQLATAQEAEQKRKQVEEAARIERSSIVFDALASEAQRLSSEASELDASIKEIADAIEMMREARAITRNTTYMAELQAEQKELLQKAKRCEEMAKRLADDAGLLPQAERMLASLTGEPMPEESGTVVEIVDEDDDDEEIVVDASVFNNAVFGTPEAAAAPELGDLLAVKPSEDARLKGVQSAVEKRAVQSPARPVARPAAQPAKPAAAPPAPRNSGDNKAHERPTTAERYAVRREIAALAMQPLPKPLQLDGTATPQPGRARLQTINNPEPKDIVVREITVGGSLMRIVSADVSGLETNAPLFRQPHNGDVVIAGHPSKKNPNTEWVIGIHPRRDVAQLNVAKIQAKLQPIFTAKELVVKPMESSGSLYLNIQVAKSGDRPLEPLDVVEFLADGSGFSWIGEPPKRKPPAKPADTAPAEEPVENGKAPGPAGIVAGSTELVIQ